MQSLHMHFKNLAYTIRQTCIQCLKEGQISDVFSKSKYLNNLITLLETISNCVSKINFQKKWQNCDFELSCQKLMIYCEYIHWFPITFWIFAPRIVKIQLFSIFDNSVFLVFGHENSNYSGIYRLLLFGSKIQIVNFEFFWNLTFWTKFGMV